FAQRNPQSSVYRVMSTDGTAAGTTCLNSPSRAYEFTSVDTFFDSGNGRAYFFAGANDSSRAGLWTTDGTAAGTTRVSGTAGLGRFVRNGLLFFGFNDTSGQLWQTDGTVQGTRIFQDFSIGHSGGKPTYFGGLDGAN